MWIVRATGLRYCLRGALAAKFGAANRVEVAEVGVVAQRQRDQCYAWLPEKRWRLVEKAPGRRPWILGARQRQAHLTVILAR
jgi:hypothetical protein